MATIVLDFFNSKPPKKKLKEKKEFSPTGKSTCAHKRIDWKILLLEFEKPEFHPDLIKKYFSKISN